ncbi:MAG: three-Cys-motif partner protein TcmP [Chloroflexi bacterium]|nr:three-Cys-motif partner protein TcmP [Chloroflexota bacterium]
MAGNKDFFKEPEEHSRIKSQIVSKYFAIWASIMAPQSQRIGYFDFFAGPGRYGSREPSTPLKILGHAISDPMLAPRLVSVFNDADPEHIKRLRQEIAGLPNIDTLAYQPEFRVGLVSDDLVAYFKQTSIIPALSFLDPWGYKGLSLRSIGALMKDWGCEVIFFFNYIRINMGIANPNVEGHMEALFGTEILGGLKRDISEKRPADREALIKEALDRALQEAG